MNAFVIYFSHAGENFSVGNIKKPSQSTVTMYAQVAGRVWKVG